MMWLTKLLQFSHALIEGIRCRQPASLQADPEASGYKGAKKNRPKENWVPGSGPADEEILFDLSDLRDRSRDLNRNNEIAAGATDTLVSQVVGSGIKPQRQVNAERLGIKPDHALEIQRQLESAWAAWKPNADSTNRLDFDDIQAMVQRQILENGEIVLLPLMVEGRIPKSPQPMPKAS